MSEKLDRLIKSLRMPSKEMTLDEICDVIESDNYSAELMMKQLLLRVQARETELLPCPFCGSRAMAWKYEWSEQIGWTVRCMGNCQVKPETVPFANESEAVQAWNLRPPTTAK